MKNLTILGGGAACGACSVSLSIALQLPCPLLCSSYDRPPWDSGRSSQEEEQAGLSVQLGHASPGRPCLQMHTRAPAPALPLHLSAPGAKAQPTASGADLRHFYVASTLSSSTLGSLHWQRGCPGLSGGWCWISARAHIAHLSTNIFPPPHSTPICNTAQHFPPPFTPLPVRQPCLGTVQPASACGVSLQPTVFESCHTSRSQAREPRPSLQTQWHLHHQPLRRRPLMRFPRLTPR